MKNFSSVSVYIVDNNIFFAPEHRSAEKGWRVIKLQNSKFTSYDCYHSEKGTLMRQALEQSGQTVSTANFNEQDYQNSLSPVLAVARVKTIHAFDREALSFSVDLDENGFTFCPCEYERGGFSGLREGTFTIPADSSDEELGKAIDKVLTFCIGKGGKRLNDFMGKQ